MLLRIYTNSCPWASQAGIAALPGAGTATNSLSELISCNFGCFQRGWDRKLKLGVKFRWETLIFWCLVFPFWKTGEEKIFKNTHTLITEIWDRSCNVYILPSIFEDFSRRLSVKLWNKRHLEFKREKTTLCKQQKTPTLITDLFHNLKRSLIFTFKCEIWIVCDIGFVQFVMEPPRNGLGSGAFQILLLFSRDPGLVYKNLSQKIPQLWGFPDSPSFRRDPGPVYKNLWIFPKLSALVPKENQDRGILWICFIFMPGKKIEAKLQQEVAKLQIYM